MFKLSSQVWPAAGGLRQRPNWKKRAMRWGVRLGGLGLLLGLLWRLHLNLSEVGAALLRVSIWPLAGAIVLIFPIIWLKAWRWRLILADLGITVRARLAWRLYGLGLAAGSLTPGQAGDAVKAWSLKEQAGYSLFRGLLSVIVDRLYDVAVLVGLAVLGLLWLGSSFAGAGTLLVLLAVLAGTGLTLLVLAVPGWRNRLFGLVYKFVIAKKLSKSSPVEIAEVSEKLRPVSLALAFFTTLLTALLALARTWLLANGLGLSLGPAEILAASSLATVASLLPFTISGIGTRDLALIAILGHLGYPQESAVSLSALLLLLNLFNLPAGYLVWRVSPAKEVNTVQLVRE